MNYIRINYVLRLQGSKPRVRPEFRFLAGMIIVQYCADVLMHSVSDGLKVKGGKR